MLPWLRCTEPKCGAPLAADDLMELLGNENGNGGSGDSAAVSLSTLCRLIATHARKMLEREEHFVPCSSAAASSSSSVSSSSSSSSAAGAAAAASPCLGGFALSLAELGAFLTYFQASRAARATAAAAALAQRTGGGFAGGGRGRPAATAPPLPLPPAPLTRTCDVCHTQQHVAKAMPALEPEVEKMIDEGKVKPCPKCSELTYKEFGVCNVLTCARCGIVWHWATLQTGRSSDELKAQARQDGTLWNPGELAFQQNLERTNPAEFKALLERNGIPYDPNYRRGQ